MRGRGCWDSVGLQLAEMRTKGEPVGWEEAYKERPRRSVQALCWMVSSLSDQHVGCREGLQEGGGHVGGALNNPTEGLVLNLEEERPAGMVFKPMEMPLGQEMTGVSEGNWETRPHIS